MTIADLPAIGDVAVDVPALLALEYACDPALCRAGRSCCAGYEVCIDEDEIPKLVGAVPLARRYVPDLPDGGNVFERLFAGLYAIDTDEDGLCVFAYGGARGETLCSIHSAALDDGFDPRAVKPRSCLLWPLAMAGSPPRYLSVDPGAYSYPCCTRRRSDGALHAGVAAHIRYVLGEEFLAELNALLAAPKKAVGD